MSTPAAHFKVGVLALCAAAALVVAVTALGLRSGREPTTSFHVLFDESVQGLDLGAAVKYRGVRVGSVAQVDVASDHRHVDVALAINAAAAARLELASPPPTLRATLSSQGVTGIHFVDLDFADPAEPEPADGPRLAGVRYLASRPSLGKELEDEARRLGRALPDLVDDARVAVIRIDDLLDATKTQQLPARIAAFVDDARGALRDLREVPPRAAAALAEWSRVAADARAAIGDAQHVLVRLDGADGLVASAQYASNLLDAVGERALDSTDDLQRMLRDVGDAARAIRNLVDELDRQPDMLLKGRAPARRP